MDALTVITRAAQSPPPAQPPNVPDPCAVCMPVHQPDHGVQFLRVPSSLFVKWADSHAKWDDAHRFDAWRQLFLNNDAWSAHLALKRAVLALSSTVANTSAHVLRLLVHGAACTRSLTQATCAVEAVLGSDDVLAVTALRPSASTAQVSTLDVSAMQRARRALHEPNAVFNATGWTRGTCASGVACAVRTKKAALRVVRWLSAGEPDAGYTRAWSAMTGDAAGPAAASPTSTPPPTGNHGAGDDVSVNEYDAWMRAWKDIMTRDGDARQHAWRLLLAAVMQDCHDAASDNGAVLCFMNAMRQGAWPLGKDNPGTPKGVPVPNRAHGNDVHCPALAMLHVCLESCDVDRMWAAAVWYAAWGYHLIPMLTLMTQLYRVAVEPPITPDRRVPSRALSAPFPVVGVPTRAEGATATAPLTRPKNNDGALEYCEALLFHHTPHPMRPAWWWHAAVPIPRHLHAAHAASAKLIRSWYRGTRAQSMGGGAAAGVAPGPPTALVPVPQQHAFAMSGTVGVAWRSAAWAAVARAVAAPSRHNADARVIVRCVNGIERQLAAMDVQACPQDWLKGGFEADAPCTPWSAVSPRCPESLQRGMHATLDKLRELPAGTPLHAVLHKAARTRATLHKWVMYHAEKARLRAGAPATRLAARTVEWVCPPAVPMLLPWPLHLSRTGVQNAQDVALLLDTAGAIAAEHGAAHAPFVSQAVGAIDALCKRGIRRAAAAASPADSVVYVMQGGHLVRAAHGGGPPVALRGKARPQSAYVIGPVSDEAVLLEATTRALLQAGGMGCPEWDGMQVLHTPYGVYTVFLRGAAYSAHEFTAVTCPHAAARTRSALRRVRAVGEMRRAVARMVQTAVHRGHVRGTERPETLLQAAVAMGRAPDSALYCAGGSWVWGTAAAYPHLHDTHAEWTRDVAAAGGGGGSGADMDAARSEGGADEAVAPLARFAVSKARFDGFAARAELVLSLLGLQGMTEHIVQSYKHLVVTA
uniref:Uncharacterized protein n=1 Tax=viral metagenome TaxID=1070528 RepID=A0A6C0AT22_9ZZZZ